ncbi:winged helix DNA-binding domain-containing protein [Paenibacillus sp. 1P07SE]|uniref:winged helix DNA-binding domain-containing protein n=1 Tax=Paenibacillus sp. 1P07SE TaxID=3132209 RepID=UPI0039A64A52
MIQPSSAQRTGRYDRQWITQLRLKNQSIHRLGQQTAYEVVRSLGAVQAQDYSQALWAIGLRMQHARAAEVECAIAEKQIVLTWALRGTLHLVAAEDVDWIIKLLTPRILAKSKPRLKALEIDSSLLSRCEDLIYRALKENMRMTRADLMGLLEEAGIVTGKGRGYHLLWYLAQIGMICMGPVEGKQQTFVLLEDWLPRRKGVSAEEALKELAERYFTGHGPATFHDFAWWAGLTLTEARAGVEAAKEALHSEKIAGVEYWMGKHEIKGDEEQPRVQLLPGYDEYLLGYKDRSVVLGPNHASLVVPGNNGVFKPMLIVDGQIAGTWRRTMTKDRIDISIHSFSANQAWCAESLEQATQRYCHFVTR